ncbi:polyprenol kinase family protein [Pleurotus pulmonarius]
MYKMERYWSPSYLVPPRNMFANIQFNPTPSAAMATFEGIDLNNQAYQAKVRGDFTEAERLYLRAIEVKERHLGPSAITTALSRNALGEVYLQMGRMVEAEDNLTKALEVRTAGGPPFDAAVTRENLAQLAEMRGRMSDAKALRLAGAPNTIACANSDCISQALSLDALKQCSTCKSVYYCSEACQRTDWRGRHRRYCPAPAL